MKKTNLKKITIILLIDEQESKDSTRPPAPKSGWSYHLPRLQLPNLSIDQLSTRINLKAISNKLLQPEPRKEDSEIAQDSLAMIDTLTLPVIPIEHVTNMVRNPQQALVADVEGPGSELRKLIKSSGIYALSSMTSPLVSLVLAPFLTHNLSPTDYGILTVTNTAIGLAAGISQLGLSAAFFRTYNYDYTSQQDRRDVVATVITLLCLISVPVAVVLAIMAPTLANFLFGRSSLGTCVILAGGVILLQNLTVPGLAWLRAEERPLSYSLLSISNLLITLLANILLVGVLHWGIPGSIIATGSGYACILICTMPIIIFRAGIKIRVDIAKNLLAFGLPLVLNFISYWVLQLSDRYLLSLFASLAETARYAVAYSLGSAMSVVVMGPFSLAWPTALFAIARRKDAIQVFGLVFRWFSMLLLFAAFALSLLGTILLDLLFPVTYHSSAFVIPIVAQSIVFYGIYYVFIVGVNVKRKTWLLSIFTTVAAISNVSLNLVLIPFFGALGAAVSTALAYVVLAVIAYIVNRRLYPIPFEIGKFIVALLIGMALYTGSGFLAQAQKMYLAWGIYIGSLIFYGACLTLLGMFPTWSRKRRKKYQHVMEDTLS